MSDLKQMSVVKVPDGRTGIVVELIPEVHLQAFRYRVRISDSVTGKDWEASFRRDELELVQL